MGNRQRTRASLARLVGLRLLADRSRPYVGRLSYGPRATLIILSQSRQHQDSLPWRGPTEDYGERGASAMAPEIPLGHVRPVGSIKRCGREAQTPIPAALSFHLRQLGISPSSPLDPIISVSSSVGLSPQWTLPRPWCPVELGSGAEPSLNLQASFTRKCLTEGKGRRGCGWDLEGTKGDPARMRRGKTVSRSSL